MEEIKTQESEKITVFEDIEKEVYKELENENKQSKAMLKKAYAERHNLMTRILQKMFGKLLTKLKIKIVVLWDEKEIFTYVIPKD